MAKVGGPGLWETRLKEKHPMLRYFTDRPFGVEIETFGLKYSISAGDRQVIPPYKIIIFSQFLVEWSQGRRPVLEYVPQPNKWFNTSYKIYLGAGMLSQIRFPPSAGEAEQYPS